MPVISTTTEFRCALPASGPGAPNAALRQLHRVSEATPMPSAPKQCRPGFQHGRSSSGMPTRPFRNVTSHSGRPCARMLRAEQPCRGPEGKVRYAYAFQFSLYCLYHTLLQFHRLRRAILMRFVPNFGSIGPMIDRFDRVLLNIVQTDDSQTAEAHAAHVPLSPSAIARRLRRLRSGGWISRTIALLSPQLTGRRLRALVFVQLAEHADQRGKERLQRRLNDTPEVQFAYEISGNHDLAVLLDCPSMDDFVVLAEELFASDSSVHRYETSFVKREVKFAPFVDLVSADD